MAKDNNDPSTDNNTAQINTGSKDNHDLFFQAEDLFKKKDLAGSFLLIKEYWLLNPDDIRAPKLLAEIMKDNGRKDLYKHLAKLGQDEKALKEDVQALFEAGYKLIDEREPELAVMLLSRCVDLEPSEAMIRYELGFALMQIRRFLDAIPHFEYLMSIEDDFDTKLNLTVCHSLARNLDKANELLEQLNLSAKSEEEKQELHLRKWVLKRLHKFDAKQKLNTRDWVYSLYGSIILSDSTPKDLSGNPRTVAADYTGIASTLLVLKGFLSEMGLDYDVIEYYNPLSRPLAEALAHLLDRPAESYGGPDRAGRSLLLMSWASDIIGPHKTFVNHNPLRSIFSYGLTTLMQLPVTPDIIGCLAAECTMPWAEQLDKAELQSDKRGKMPILHPMNQIQTQATDQILARASDLESNMEVINQIKDLGHYYSARKDFIVLANSEKFSERPEYTSEIPF